MLKYRKHKKTKVIVNDWDWAAEPGDLYVYDSVGLLARIHESSSWGRRAAGELTTTIIKPPKGYTNIYYKDGILYWVTEEEWKKIEREEYGIKRVVG